MFLESTHQYKTQPCKTDKRRNKQMFGTFAWSIAVLRIITNVADSLSIHQLVVTAADSAQTMSGYFYAYTEMCNIASHCIILWAVHQLTGITLSVLLRVLFPCGYVLIHLSGLVLDSAKWNEELPGLSGQQRGVRCIRLTPVFQPDCPRQTQHRDPSYSFVWWWRISLKSCSWEWSFRQKAFAYTTKLYSRMQFIWSIGHKIYVRRCWRLKKPTKPKRAGKETVKICGRKQNRNAYLHFSSSWNQNSSGRIRAAAL